MSWNANSFAIRRDLSEKGTGKGKRGYQRKQAFIISEECNGSA
jgi:hypothetical protein